ncbi:MAG: tetratricopeptide repeat protein [Planctomycetes bacterium]|nr:tetratricopeptide repeat protein [Planctomycetota bacterium]
MIAGLFVGAVLCTAAEPEAPKLSPPLGAPGMSEAHKDALARYGAAAWNLRRERLLTAARQLEAAAKADPEATEPVKELARLYAQLGREVEAIRLARKALQQDPTDADTAILLARLLADAGELKDAVAAAKLALDSKSLAEKPEKAVRAYRDLAALCERADDLAAAESALGKAVELLVEKRAAVIAAFAFTPKGADAEAAECLERLGRVLVKRRKFDAATDAFEAAAGLYADPKRVDDPAGAVRLAWNLSGALEAKGDPAGAIKYLEQFLKLQPRAAEPYRRYARLLRAVNRDNDVVKGLQKYANGDKTNRPLAAVLAAEIARDPNTRDDADALFFALTRETAEPEVIAVVVRSHLETRRPVEIIKDLDRAFAVLKDDNKEPKEPDTPARAAAKAFAGEKARAYADALETEPDGVAALLRAAGDDLRAGTNRAHGTYYFLGALAARHRKLELAALQFRQAARFAPPAAQWDAYSSLLQVLRLAGKSAEIETVCRDALAAGDLNGVEVLFNFHLSLALAEQGKTAAALAAADKTIQQAGDADRLTVRLRRHTVLCVLGKWDEAIEYGKKLADEFDAPADRARVRYAQAGAYWGAKRTADAEAALRAILDDDPDNAGACNDLGYHLADQGRNLEEAERLVRHALAVDRIDRRKAGSAEPENAAFRDSLGWVLFRQGKLVDARAELERAAALPAGAADPVAWDHLGDVLFRLNDKPKAKAAWEKAKELYEADARVSSRGRRDGRLDEVQRKLKRVP